MKRFYTFTLMFLFTSLSLRSVDTAHVQETGITCKDGICSGEENNITLEEAFNAAQLGEIAILEAYINQGGDINAQVDNDATLTTGIAIDQVEKDCNTFIESLKKLVSSSKSPGYLMRGTLAFSKSLEKQQPPPLDCKVWIATLNNEIDLINRKSLITGAALAEQKEVFK